MEVERAGRAINLFEGLLPHEQAPVPLVPDDAAMDDNDDFEDFVEDIERVRSTTAARTLYHQPRTDADTVNSTRSLHACDIEYFTIHERRYCGDYYMPNDEPEQERGQMLHSIYKKIFNDCLTSVPLHNPTKILDVGTGTGEWVMDMGDQYPDADVIGTDIARIQDTAVPRNVFFEIDDAEYEDGWTWGEEFDLVHFRNMQGAFKDWKFVYKEAFKCLKPGGYIEVIDFDNHSKLMSYFHNEPDVVNWLAAVNEASNRAGRPRGDAHLDSNLLKELGFMNVSITEKIIPTGAWPKDEDVQNLGKHFLVAQLYGVEAVCLRPLTEYMGWSVEDVTNSVNFVQQRMKSVAMNKETSQGMGFIVKVLVGMKPSDDDLPEVDLPEVDLPEVDIPDEESIKTMTNLNGNVAIKK